MNWKLFAIFMILVSVGGAGFYYNSHLTKDGTQGFLREVTAKDLLQHIEEQKSPLVLVNFWASWCEPCKVEFPHIMEVRSKYLDRGLRVVLVSIDDTEDRLAAETFLRAQRVDVPSFYKGKTPLKFVTDVYPRWTGAVPTTLLIGADQKIVDAWEGDTSLKEFEARVERHLKGS
jgi:thiol-disulfide isomerase/thioredoxin